MTTPTTPGQALRWAADRIDPDGLDGLPARAVHVATAAQLRRWADDLDAAPAVYALPAEPGGRVRTADHQVWLHDGDDPTRRWRREVNYRGERVASDVATRMCWSALLDAYGPLWSVPPAGAEAELG